MNRLISRRNFGKWEPSLARTAGSEASSVNKYAYLFGVGKWVEVVPQYLWHWIKKPVTRELSWRTIKNKIVCGVSLFIWDSHHIIWLRRTIMCANYISYVDHRGQIRVTTSSLRIHEKIGLTPALERGLALTHWRAFGSMWELWQPIL